MNTSLQERMQRAMEENRKTDEIALKTLGFKNIDEFIAFKLTANISLPN